ncbi:MAG: primosomal protein N' [Peptococcaceae bacterium]|nr:primosomal protein N' [Peptococcaceae bacterium]
MPKYAEVLVDVANRRLDRSYHYLIPEDLPVKVGMSVIVPLKNRQVQALVVKVSENPPELDRKITFKPISKILEGDYLVPSELIEIACWLAETTICPIAQALHTVWPFFKGKLENWIIPCVQMEDDDVKALELLDPDSHNVLKVLHRARRVGLPEKTLLKRANVESEFLEGMVNQGWLKKESRFIPRGSSQPMAPVFQEQPLSENDWNSNSINLSPVQRKALQDIWELYQKKQGETVLLHGVTGSGKTEIYRALVAKVLLEGGDAIILVPEISLASQVSKVFLAQFGDLVAVIHSGINFNEKLKIWQAILGGQKKVIIGARSAVFAPLPKLKLIILDEEHDNAYKQDENPKYHARDVARKRMEQKKGLVLLGSATPSLEAYAAAQRKKITLVKLEHRYNQRPLPQVEIVDMKRELANGNKSLFSESLREKLRDRITKGEQSILFLNRRGYATFVFCRVCGFVAQCPNCDIALTYHSNRDKLLCHYCDYQQEIIHLCPECGSKYIRFYGQGTERVEEEVTALFPGVDVLRLDTDTTLGTGKHEEILQKFRQGQVPIMVGTQMLAKGLDFPNVTLVGVILADQLLNMPDFRSRERTFQLLTQVAGRAGRGTIQGDVVIQTYTPEDRAIIKAAEQDYPAFFWQEIAYRKKLGYPPFSHLLRILLFHENEERLIKAANGLAARIRTVMSKQEIEQYAILGPAPAVLTKLKNEYRWQVLLKGKNPAVLRKIAHSGIKAFYDDSLSSGINLSIELNPLSV